MRAVVVTDDRDGRKLSRLGLVLVLA